MFGFGLLGLMNWDDSSRYYSGGFGSVQGSMAKLQYLLAQQNLTHQQQINRVLKLIAARSPSKKFIELNEKMSSALTPESAPQLDAWVSLFDCAGRELVTP